MDGSKYGHWYSSNEEYLKGEYTVILGLRTANQKRVKDKASLTTYTLSGSAGTVILAGNVTRQTELHAKFNDYLQDHICIIGRMFEDMKYKL